MGERGFTAHKTYETALLRTCIGGARRRKIQRARKSAVRQAAGQLSELRWAFHQPVGRPYVCLRTTTPEADAQHAEGTHLRRELGLGPDSQVLLINSEINTDPEYFRRVAWEGANPVPADYRFDPDAER